MSFSSGHFWSDAPTVSWQTYLYRLFFDSSRQAPILLSPSSTLSKSAYPSVKGLSITPVSPICVYEYSDFLKAHFYSRPGSTSQIKLVIPPETLEHYLKSGVWSGVEVRATQTKELIGIAIQKLCLQKLYTFPVACVEWVCVHRAYRERGVADILLRSLYVYSIQEQKPPIYAHIFRKEGLALRIPPAETQTVILRKRHHRSTVKSNSYRIQKTASDTLIFSTDAVTLYIQPTYEILGSLHTFEIVHWISVGEQESKLPYLIEELIDSLPPYIEALYASSTIPHIDSIGWEHQGKQSWYAFHYDPGNPVSIIRY